MYEEAKCLFENSDYNHDGRLSHESTRAFVHKYIAGRENEEYVNQAFLKMYGPRVRREEFYQAYGFLKYHEPHRIGDE